MGKKLDKAAQKAAGMSPVVAICNGGQGLNEYPLRDEELEFINAVNEYKRRYSRPFPTWSEALHVLKSLGYRKVQ